MLALDARLHQVFIVIEMFRETIRRCISTRLLRNSSSNHNSPLKNGEKNLIAETRENRGNRTSAIAIRVTETPGHTNGET